MGFRFAVSALAVVVAASNAWASKRSIAFTELKPENESAVLQADAEKHCLKNEKGGIRIDSNVALKSFLKVLEPCQAQGRLAFPAINFKKFTLLGMPYSGSCNIVFSKETGQGRPAGGSHLHSRGHPEVEDDLLRRGCPEFQFHSGQETGLGRAGQFSAR
jgi:hypothetical protein